MRILTVHNYYQQSGGEDVVFNSEKDLLRSMGHDVFVYEETNDRIKSMNPSAVALETIWSDSSYNNIRKLILEKEPNVVHLHNTFVMISPSVYYACHDVGVPVIQTLHNYRLSCPVAVFYRDGSVCEDCLGKTFPWPSVLHRCYRKSRLQSFVVASMLTYHRLIRTWSEKVTTYIALTEFSRGKMIEAGLPSTKIFVKPNFVKCEKFRRSTIGDYTLFVGRLSQEKGIRTLLAAWKSLSIPLKIAGDGPMRLELQKSLQQPGLSTVTYLGALSHAEVLALMKQARFLIFPSEWYEGFPMAIAEAFGCGLPILASRLGAMAEIIQDGETGLLFTPGDYNEMADKALKLWNNPSEVRRMGHNARKEYEQKYTPEINYEMLMGIYSHALENKGL